MLDKIKEIFLNNLLQFKSMSNSQNKKTAKLQNLLFYILALTTLTILLGLGCFIMIKASNEIKETQKMLDKSSTKNTNIISSNFENGEMFDDQIIAIFKQNLEPSISNIRGLLTNLTINYQLKGTIEKISFGSGVKFVLNSKDQKIEVSTMDNSVISTSVYKVSSDNHPTQADIYHLKVGQTVTVDITLSPFEKTKEITIKIID
jgi:hypothetical protein